MVLVAAWLRCMQQNVCEIDRRFIACSRGTWCGEGLPQGLVHLPHPDSSQSLPCQCPSLPLLLLTVQFRSSKSLSDHLLPRFARVVLCTPARLLPTLYGVLLPATMNILVRTEKASVIVLVSISSLREGARTACLSELELPSPSWAYAIDAKPAHVPFAKRTWPMRR